ncbi:hypothetical protein KKC06_01100 [Patescibacteria group bacterium]|nr:hypothetical protein [Patescibacteria group bacterium]
MAPSDVPNDERALTPMGYALCHNVASDYQQLLTRLGLHFKAFNPESHTQIKCSPLPRALITAALVTEFGRITPNPSLQLQVSIIKIDDGRQYETWKAANMSLRDMMLAIHKNQSLVQDQPYEQRMAEMTNLLVGSTDRPLVIYFGHEPEATLWALARFQIEPDEAGLAECQAYIVFTHLNGSLTTIKFCPPATIK